MMYITDYEAVSNPVNLVGDSGVFSGLNVMNLIPVLHQDADGVAQLTAFSLPVVRSCPGRTIGGGLQA